MRPAAIVRLRISCSLKFPVRSECPSTLARLDIIRFSREVAVISIEKIPTGTLSFMATCSAIDIASEVLPIEGRAARMNTSPSWNPVVRRSRAGKPEAMPVQLPLLANARSISPTVCLTASFRLTSPPLFSCWSRSTRVCSPCSSFSSSPSSLFCVAEIISLAAVIIRRSFAFLAIAATYVGRATVEGVRSGNPARYGRPPTSSTPPG